MLFAQLPPPGGAVALLAMTPGAACPVFVVAAGGGGGGGAATPPLPHGCCACMLVGAAGAGAVGTAVLPVAAAACPAVAGIVAVMEGAADGTSGTAGAHCMGGQGPPLGWPVGVVAAVGAGELTACCLASAGASVCGLVIDCGVVIKVLGGLGAFSGL